MSDEERIALLAVLLETGAPFEVRMYNEWRETQCLDGYVIAGHTAQLMDAASVVKARGWLAAARLFDSCWESHWRLAP